MPSSSHVDERHAVTSSSNQPSLQHNHMVPHYTRGIMIFGSSIVLLSMGVAIAGYKFFKLTTKPDKEDVEETTECLEEEEEDESDLGLSFDMEHSVCEICLRQFTQHDSHRRPLPKHGTSQQHESQQFDRYEDTNEDRLSSTCGRNEAPHTLFPPGKSSTGIPLLLSAHCEHCTRKSATEERRSYHSNSIRRSSSDKGGNINDVEHPTVNRSGGGPKLWLQKNLTAVRLPVAVASGSSSSSRQKGGDRKHRRHRRRQQRIDIGITTSKAVAADERDPLNYGQSPDDEDEVESATLLPNLNKAEEIPDNRSRCSRAIDVDGKPGTKQQQQQQQQRDADDNRRSDTNDCTSFDDLMTQHEEPAATKIRDGDGVNRYHHQQLVASPELPQSLMSETEKVAQLPSEVCMSVKFSEDPYKDDFDDDFGLSSPWSHPNDQSFGQSSNQEAFL